jgi:RHS repeat-associated protein
MRAPAPARDPRTANANGSDPFADGPVVAQYDQGPFGELLRASGPLARENPFRFSTKYQDDETDLICFGPPCYPASLGRWLSRDQFSSVLPA